MQFTFEKPATIEVLASEDLPNGIKLTPALVKGQHILRVGYVTAVGAQGNTTKAVIMFNANTGQFTVQDLGQDVVFDFDKTQEEFRNKRKASQQNGAKAQKSQTISTGGTRAASH